MVYKAWSRLTRPAGNVLTAGGRRLRDAAVVRLGINPLMSDLSSDFWEKSVGCYVSGTTPPRSINRFTNNLKVWTLYKCKYIHCMWRWGAKSSEPSVDSHLRHTFIVTSTSLGVCFCSVRHVSVQAWKNCTLYIPRLLSPGVQMFTPLNDVLSGFGSPLIEPALLCSSWKCRQCLKWFLLLCWICCIPIVFFFSSLSRSTDDC